MKTPLFAVVALASLLSSASAWDDLGHMIVAASAYDQLTPEVREKVSTLLRLNPKYATWVANVPKIDRPRVAFLRASLWPDDIKVDPAYKQDGRHDGNRPSGRKAARNIGYADKLQHKYWHFINLPFSPDNTRLAGPLTPNAKTQIALFRKTLKSSTSSSYLKSYDLVWLIHLVADVHQPLHATSRFTKAHKEGDDGGNGVMVCSHPCQTREKLHAFWDELLGLSMDTTTAIDKAKQLPVAEPQLASISDEGIWIQESFDAAQTHVYVSPIEVGVGPYEVTEGYKAAAQELASQRIALAGARLANLLNDALR
jgi:hypothetical protein